MREYLSRRVTDLARKDRTSARSRPPVDHSIIRISANSFNSAHHLSPSLRSWPSFRTRQEPLRRRKNTFGAYTPPPQ